MSKKSAFNDVQGQCLLFIFNEHRPEPPSPKEQKRKSTELLPQITPTKKFKMVLTKEKREDILKKQEAKKYKLSIPDLWSAKKRDYQSRQ